MSPYTELRNGSTPVVVLVHDAFTDASSWQGVIAELQLRGIEAVALANPLRGLEPDAAYVACLAGEIDGPVVLVGHSYGGAVITVAGASTRNVLGLVYVAGYALEEGESVLDLTNRFADTMLTAFLRPAVARVGDEPPTVSCASTTTRSRPCSARISQPPCQRSPPAVSGRSPRRHSRRRPRQPPGRRGGPGTSWRRPIA
jgi:pimeloyl-ACP methyl ester carboxylesterase